MLSEIVTIFSFTLASSLFSVECAKQPNILFVLADDLGYNDVGYRGNNQVKTPNIDALAYNGAILERFYSLPMCTPSRAAILTGKYPIRTGFQGYPMGAGQERHLPFDVPILPEQLKKLGYNTHLVGKWHLGYAWRNVTPIRRGFDTHYGYYNGAMSYFDHIVEEKGMKGFDFRDDFAVARETTGLYATDLFTNRTVKIIKEHDYQKPLFILLCHLAVHAGKNVPIGMVEEKDTASMQKNFGYIKDINRRRYVDALKSLDDSIGTLVKTLAQKNVLDNTIIFFVSDNGSPTFAPYYTNYGSNWPMRGMKFSHYEGGVRGTAIFYSKNMAYRGKVNSNLMHMTDVLPTLYAAAGGSINDLGKLDGVNQLDALMGNEKTKRKELLVNIEDVAGSSAIITHDGRYKLIKGIQYSGSYDSYTGVSGRLSEDGNYDVNAVLRSDVNEVLGRGLKAEDVENLRKASTTKNCRKKTLFAQSCDLCLYNLEDDPCETTNIAYSRKDLVEQMTDRLEYFNSQLIPQQSNERDPRSNPEYFGGVWTYWLDQNNTIT